MVPLVEVLELQRRWVKLEPLETYREIGIRSFGKGIFHKAPINGSTLGNKRVLRIEPGDLVFNNVFAWEGAVAVAGPDEAGMIGSHRFVTYTVNARKAVPEFLRLFFTTKAGLEILGKASPGSAGRNKTLGLDRFISYSIPLPPLSEQQKIVEWVDAVATRIKEASELRNRANSLIDVVLQARRETLFLNLERSNGIPLGQIADCRLGKMLSGNQTDHESGTPYLRNANIQWDRLDLSSVNRMEVSEKDREELSLREGDILICEGGDIGKCAIWNNELSGCIFQKALHRVRVDRKLVRPRYLLHQLVWLAKRGDFTGVKTQTTIAHLTGVVLKRIQVQLPSIHLQDQIVGQLDGLKRHLEQCRSVSNQLTSEMKSLFPAVLHEVFQGSHDEYSG